MQFLQFHSYRPYIFIVFIWMAIIIVVNPIGDYPINDDWAYAENVQEMVLNGKIHFSEWPAMTLITQTCIGALSSLLFGFSFTVLRITTLLIAMLCLFTLYQILRDQSIDQKTGLLATAILAANPLFFSLSFSFMTEVYYLCFLLLSVLVFQRYFTTKATQTYILLIVLFVLTIYIRQTALILPIAFAIVSILSDRLSLRSIFHSLFPLIIGYVSIVIYKQVRLTTGNSLGSFSDISMLFRSIGETEWNTYVVRTGTILLYLGLFLSPIALLLAPKLRFRCKGSRLLGFVPIAMVLGFCIHGAWSSFPSGNILYDTGLGARILKDNVFNYNVVNSSPVFVWEIIKLIASFSITVCSISLYLILLRSLRGSNWYGFKTRIRTKPLRYFLLLFIFGEIAYLLINPIFFDRYTLSLSALSVIVLFSAEWKQFNNLNWSYGAVALFLTFCIISTHDYLRWQESRSLALRELQRMSIPMTKIDAGFELNAMAKVAPMSEVSYEPDKMSWWWVDDDEYLITSGDFPGYKRVFSIPVRSWLYNNKMIYALKKYHTDDRMDGLKVRCDFETLSADSRLFINSNDEAFMDARIGEQARSGSHSLLVDGSQPYSINYLISSLKANETISVSIYHKGAPSYLILDSKEKNRPVVRISSENEKVLNDGWKKITASVVVDSTWTGRDLYIYVFNPNTDPAYFDDLNIKVN